MSSITAPSARYPRSLTVIHRQGAPGEFFVRAAERLNAPTRTTTVHAKDKFIAFIDVLGFTNLVEQAEAEGGDFTRALELAAALGDRGDSDIYKDLGPTTCPCSTYVAKDLDFQLTQISDCVVVSAEVSPAGLVNLISHCSGIAIRLLQKGALCRGFITRGAIHHEPGQFIGTGYMNAYKREAEVAFLRADEAEKGTPFIQIDEVVLDYAANHTDRCVQEQLARATRSDGEYRAIYPFGVFKNIPGAIMLPGHFNPTHFLENVRKSIGYRQRDLQRFQDAEAAAPNERAKRKIRHYSAGIEEVIDHLRGKERRAEQMIATGNIPWGSSI